MAASTVLVLVMEAAVTLLRFVLGFYAFWLVLRALEGFMAEDTRALRELDPLACDFTDPFVQPVSRVTRLAPTTACWLWLVVFAIVHAGLGRVTGLL